MRIVPGMAVYLCACVSHTCSHKYTSSHTRLHALLCACSQHKPCAKNKLLGIAYLHIYPPCGLWYIQLHDIPNLQSVVFLKMMGDALSQQLLKLTGLLALLHMKIHKTNDCRAMALKERVCRHENLVLRIR